MHDRGGAVDGPAVQHGATWQWQGDRRDVYVSLGEKLEDGSKPAWAMRVYHKPFVPWIWVGCMLMALGGAMAALDKRYRKKVAAKISAKDIKGVVA